jgi:hypothetical protein
MGRPAAQIARTLPNLPPPRNGKVITVPKALCSSEIPDWSTGRDHLRSRNDSASVYAIVPVQLVDRAGLAEMLDPQWANAVATDSAEPRQGRRVSVQNGDDTAMSRQAG